MRERAQRVDSEVFLDVIGAIFDLVDDAERCGPWAVVPLDRRTRLQAAVHELLDRSSSDGFTGAECMN